MFAWAMAPGLYLLDSGELAAAAFTLGVAHETGFPLWCLLGKLATLLPLGEVATRITLVSALTAALAATLVARLAALLLGDRPAALAAGIGGAALLVAGYTFWKQAIVAEVYAPTAAALALALLLAEGAARGRRGCGLGLALLGGLALGLHASFRLLALFPLIVLIGWRLRRGDRWPLLAPFFAALGAVVLVYLPLRAARHPLANWGDAETLIGWWHHLTAARIRRAFAGEIMSLDLSLVLRHLATLLAQIETQLGLPALLAAAVGLGWLIIRRRAIGLLTVCLVIGELAYAAWVNPMGIADLQCGVPALIGIALAAAVGVGVAAEALVRAAGRRDEEDPNQPRRARLFGRVAGTSALVGIILAPAALSPVGTRFGIGQEASAWTSAALRDAPERALALVQSDDVAAGTLYAQAVWGLRPDVTILVRQHLFDADYLADRLARSHSDVVDTRTLADWRTLGETERLRRQPRLLRSLIERNLGRRPILWEPGDDSPPRGWLSLDVPLARLEQAPPPTPRPSVRLVIDRLERLLGHVQDEPARRLETTALTQVASRYIEGGDRVSAGILYGLALALRPDDAVAMLGLGVVRASRGEFAVAARLAERVIALEPNRAVARLNAGRYRLALGDLAAAEAHFLAAAQLRPRQAAPLVGLARVRLAADRTGEAKRLLEQARLLEPRDPEIELLTAELP